MRYSLKQDERTLRKRERLRTPSTPSIECTQVSAADQRFHDSIQNTSGNEGRSSTNEKVAARFSHENAKKTKSNQSGKIENFRDTCERFVCSERRFATVECAWRGMEHGSTGVSPSRRHSVAEEARQLFSASSGGNRDAGDFRQTFKRGQPCCRAKAGHGTGSRRGSQFAGIRGRQTFQQST